MTVTDIKMLTSSLEDISQLPATMLQLQYEQTFCLYFAEYGQVAWKDLLTLLPGAVSYVNLGNRAMRSGSLRRSVLEKLILDVEAWSTRFQLNATWVVNAATSTLVYSAYLTSTEGRRIDRMIRRIQTIPGEIRRGGLSYSLAPAEVHTLAEVDVFVETKPYTWNPLNETKAQFQKRAGKEFAARLKDSMTLGEYRHPTISPIQVDYIAVEYLIRLRAGGQSIAGISTSMGVLRGTVQFAIDRAIDRLGLPPRVQSS